MNDFMDDFNSPQTPSSPAKPPVSGAAQERVFTSADVYEAGKLTPVHEDSVLMEIFKGILGAVVGAIPGVLLWILIGRVGFIAAICGAILAGGTVAGYIFMSKDNFLPQSYGVIICLAVIIIAVFLAQKIVWCWEIADVFERYFGDYRKEMYEVGDAAGMSRSEVDAVIDSTIKEEFGFSDVSFGNCFSNFGRMLGNLGMRGKYFLNLLECYGFAALGGGSLFAKFAKK
ncbi:MAG: hypothetical protein IJ071_04945 [Ruminococcus sp.]|nr:hypothetical protein [Ruminococcus sp.]